MVRRLQQLLCTKDVLSFCDRTFSHVFTEWVARRTIVWKTQNLITGVFKSRWELGAYECFWGTIQKSHCLPENMKCLIFSTAIKNRERGYVTGFKNFYITAWKLLEQHVRSGGRDSKKFTTALETGLRIGFAIWCISYPDNMIAPIQTKRITANAKRNSGATIGLAKLPCIDGIYLNNKERVG